MLHGSRLPVGRCLFASFALLLLLAAPAATAADLVEGRVIRIADGETLSILVDGQTPVKVRLAGIDAPERAQPFVERSCQNLTRLIAGEPVEVRWHKRDRYGRVVGQVWVVAPDARCRDAGCPKTLAAGLAPVTVGLAWHYKQYAGEQSAEDRERYSFAEVKVRARRCGGTRRRWRRGSGGRVRTPPLAGARVLQ